MLATPGPLPTGAGWSFEVKWDGMRVLAEVTDGGGEPALRLRTRSGRDVTANFPELAGLVDLAPDVLLDGEVVLLDGGVPSFAALAHRIHGPVGGRPVTFMVFDVLRLYGVPLLDRPLADIGGFGLITDLRGSYVRAELDDGSNVPRIPPLELLGALELQSDALDLRGEVQWFAEQDRISAFETPTDDFAFVNLLASWRPLGDRSVTLQLAADNIFDVTGRRHASFTKDFVPLAGRNVKASVRLSF